MFGFKKSKPQTFNNDYGYQQNYDIKLANLESKYASMKEAKEYYEKEYKKLKGITESLCKSIVSNQYNISQLGGNSILQDLDIYKLVDFTKIDYQKQKIENMDTLKQLNEQIKMQGIMIDSLKKQLTQAMLQNHKDISMEEVEDATIIDNSEVIEPAAPTVTKIERDSMGNIKDIPSPSTIASPKGNRHNKQQPRHQQTQSSLSSNTSPVLDFAKNRVPTQAPSRKSNNSQENTPTLTIENVDVYMSAMTDIMWEILEAIGTEGFAKSNDILNWIDNKSPNKYAKSNVLNSLTTLKKMNIVTADNVSTGYRRFQIFKFSQKGEEMFKAKFNREPVESEIDKIIRDHDNVTHGYTIKDSCELLLNYHQCTDVVMDRQEVSIKLPNGETYIPDIIATKENGEKMYIEVELGNTPQKDFNNKCKKMLQVTKTLYFVTDTEETIRKKLEGQVSMWILSMGGKEKVTGTTVYLTTMNHLSKGEFTKVLHY